MRAMFLFGFLGLVGCPDVEDEPTTVEFHDEGTLCRQGSDLLLDWETCLSSSCDTLTLAECTASLSGGVLTLTSHGEITSVGTTCTDDCGSAQVVCSLPEITDPSAVTVEHGTESVTLDAIPACPAI